MLRTLFFLLCCGGALLAQENDETLQRPSIILVMADDQGWGDTGYNGHPFVQTPALDEMARKGLVFDRFYAAAPVCSPTRASVLTGRHPLRGKVPNHGRYLRPHEYTLAEALRDAGYVTGLFGKYHLGAAQPDTPCNPGGMGFEEWVIGLNFFDNDPYLSRQGHIEQHQGRGSVLLMDHALDFLARHQKGEKPLFAVIWFPSPHLPHAESTANEELYQEHEHAAYYREITLLDQQVGRLRSTLQKSPIAENTILWFCSDNGGLVSATSGGRNKKGSVYEGGLRVPAIVEWPSRSLSGRCAHPVSTSDLYPTLLAWAGISTPPPHPLDGIDITPLLAEDSPGPRPPLGFWHHFQEGQSTHSDAILQDLLEKQEAGAPRPHNQARLRKDVDEFPLFSREEARGHAAWLDWPWKLHRIDGDRYELYHLGQDPGERQDRSGEPSSQDQLEKMKKGLHHWMSSVIDSLNGADYDLQGE
ncbi:sulfatase-like hydrolase/transferase [Roseibacillus ishigakijimensis]|uniref:Sulfatase-like hydrolase/transferase n=1 Tax=Roseibacillus ishigakijimensis TaxID=454146 RepID=A0A934VG90_9BACT|nr:sulfatase-like hydrolase/transferase [Roseibacillus ishigakijimensis]MBK1832593.1 sulfatase-like hydrolase/transferase [Roseibacillus ishigakijimensis]